MAKNNMYGRISLMFDEPKNRIKTRNEKTAKIPASSDMYAREKMAGIIKSILSSQKV